jgi:hypothetical protein
MPWDMNGDAPQTLVFTPPKRLRSVPLTVDPPVRPVRPAALLLRLVDLDVRDIQAVHVKTLDLQTHAGWRSSSAGWTLFSKGLVKQEARHG